MNPDVVVGYYLTSYGLVSALAWEGALVLAAAGSDILRPRMRFAGPVYWYLKQRGDLFIAWSPHMAKRLEELGMAPNKITTLHRGIDDHVFRPDGPKVPATSRYRLVSTRNFRPIYQLETLVTATGLVARRGYDATYQLLGRGPLLLSLQDLARRLGIADRVSFPGYFAPAGVASYLRGADVYVSASESDGASSSLFEAMACGALPVVSDIPANRDWIDPGVNGYLAAVGDAEAFARAICNALDSNDLRQRAADYNSGLVAEKLTRAKNQQLLTQSFRELIDAKARAARGPAFRLQELG
jgi:glycosyltransferase involved in cell wall biosynthesis